MIKTIFLLIFLIFVFPIEYVILLILFWRSRRALWAYKVTSQCVLLLVFATLLIGKYVKFMKVAYWIFGENNFGSYKLIILGDTQYTRNLRTNHNPPLFLLGRYARQTVSWIRTPTISQEQKYVLIVKCLKFPYVEHILFWAF